MVDNHDELMLALGDFLGSAGPVNDDRVSPLPRVATSDRHLTQPVMDIMGKKSIYSVKTL